MNLSHRTQSDQQKGTFRCTKCETQFSSKWNLNNHTRDDHEKTKDCEFFKEGKCQFPESICWDRHDKSAANTSNVIEKIDCHTCKNTFKTKTQMMVHRKEKHPEKVKPCREQEGCTRRVCWYIHMNTITTANAIEEEPEAEEWLNSEMDSETEDFQLPPIPPNPPEKQA